jgi:hypothetical protein
LVFSYLHFAIFPKSLLDYALGNLSGKVETVHLGRDATDTIQILLGVMGQKTLSGKVVMEGCPGDTIENPLSPTPPTSAWFKVDEKAITVMPSGTNPPPSGEGMSGLAIAAIAGIGLLALSSSGGSGKKKK